VSHGRSVPTDRDTRTLVKPFEEMGGGSPSDSKSVRQSGCKKRGRKEGFEGGSGSAGKEICVVGGTPDLKLGIDWATAAEGKIG